MLKKQNWKLSPALGSWNTSHELCEGSDFWLDAANSAKQLDFIYFEKGVEIFDYLFLQCEKKSLKLRGKECRSKIKLKWKTGLQCGSVAGVVWRLGL